MVEVVLEGLAKHVDEGTIQTWFIEEGDAINEGDDLVALSTEDGVVTIQAPSSGILAEVYYDEGEVVEKGEVLCSIDPEMEDEDDDEDEEEDDDEEDEDGEDDDEEDSLDDDEEEEEDDEDDK